MRRTATASWTISARPPVKSADRRAACSRRQSQRSSETSFSDEVRERKMTSWQYPRPARRPTPRKPRALPPRFALPPIAVSWRVKRLQGMPVPLSWIRIVRAVASGSTTTRPASVGDNRPFGRVLHVLAIDRHRIDVHRRTEELENVLADEDTVGSGRPGALHRSRAPHFGKRGGSRLE